MRRSVASLALGLVLLLGGVARAETSLLSFMLGENEVPPVRTPGYGIAFLYIPDDQSFIYYYVYYTELRGRATQALIHVGSQRENGAAIFNLAGIPGGTEGEYDGFLTARDFRPGGGLRTYEQAVAAILRERTYVNLGTSVYPRGEVRGQTLRLEK